MNGTFNTNMKVTRSKWKCKIFSEKIDVIDEKMRNVRWAEVMGTIIQQTQFFFIKDHNILY